MVFLQQAVHVNSQVASVMFVLALASVNLAFANPICTECGNSTSDSASKTVSGEKLFVFLSSLVSVSGVLW